MCIWYMARVFFRKNICTFHFHDGGNVYVPDIQGSKINTHTKTIWQTAYINFG